MADLTSQFAGPAQVADMTPNADVDNAMGFGANPNDSWAQSFAKGLQSSMFRNSDEGRKLTIEVVKQKMAAQLASQLEERKLQLAQQYPKYEFHQTPWGSEAVLNPGTGHVEDTADAAAPDSLPGLAKAKYSAQAKADTAKFNTEATPEYQKAVLDEAVAKPGLVNAQTKFYGGAKTDAAEASAEARRAAAAKDGLPKKEWSPAMDAQVQAAARIKFAQSIGMLNYKPGDALSDMTIREAIEKDPSSMARLKQYETEERMKYANSYKDVPGVSGQGAGLGSPQPPDLSAITSPLQVQ